MGEYLISETTPRPGYRSNGVVPKDVFAEALAQRWPDACSEETTDQRNPFVLNWRIQIDADELAGQLGREWHRVRLRGSAQSAAAFAVWYRALVPQILR